MGTRVTLISLLLWAAVGAGESSELAGTPSTGEPAVSADSADSADQDPNGTRAQRRSQSSARSASGPVSNQATDPATERTAGRPINSDPRPQTASETKPGPKALPFSKPAKTSFFSIPKDTAVTVLPQRTTVEKTSSSSGFKVRGAAGRTVESLFPPEEGRPAEAGEEKGTTTIEADSENPSQTVETSEKKIHLKNLERREREARIRDAKGVTVGLRSSVLEKVYSEEGVNESEVVKELDPATREIHKITATKRESHRGELIRVERTVTTMKKPLCPALKVQIVEFHDRKNVPVEITRTSYDKNCRALKVETKTSRLSQQHAQPDPLLEDPAAEPVASEAVLIQPARMPKALFEIRR
jgi:hypothetical protein